MVSRDRLFDLLLFVAFVTSAAGVVRALLTDVTGWVSPFKPLMRVTR